MKKGLLALLLTASIILLSGCNNKEEENNTLPVITGVTEVSYDEGSEEPNWLDLITATDEEDGDFVLDLTNVNLDNVDMDTPGTFDVVYTVTDLDGGVATHTITVTIEEVIVIVYDTPMISNPTDVYATINDVDFTRGEAWDYMVDRFGLNMMLQLVEGELFADEIATITDEQVLEAKNELLFGTNDAEMIAEIMADEDRYQQLINIYEEQLLFLGYNADDADDVREFFALQLAKEQYTKDFLINAGVENTFTITDEQLEEFYNELNTAPVCALSVVFNSENEIDAIFNQFNLVANYNYGIGEYYGATPIEDVSSDIFDETNTTQLTDDQVFSKYVLLYNYMNPNKEQLPTNLTKEEYCNSYPELANHDKNEMLDGINYSSHPMTLYANLVFNTLKIDQEGYSRYSYRSQNIAGDLVFAFKVNKGEVPEFSTLSEEEKTALKEDFASEMINSQEVILAITNNLFTEHELKIIHPIFELQYEIQNQADIVSYGSLVNVAEYGDIVVSADDLFDYIDERIGVNIIMSLYEVELLINSEIYEELYGEDTSFMTSDNETLADFRDQILGIKSNFVQGAYLQYGFDPTEMTYEEFLYAGFGEVGEENVMLNIFILPNLQFEYAYGNLPEYSTYVPFMQSKYDEYFSLTTEHIILYVDEDNDFIPDDFSDFLDSLSAEELTEFNTLKVSLENGVAQQLSEGLSLQQIASSFKNGLIDDEENIWKDLKAFGFKIKHEQLSILSSDSVGAFDEGFKDSLVRLADMLYRPENESMTEYYDDQVTTTDFGIHMIYVKKSSLFEKPNAEYEETDPLYPAYSVGAESDTVVPSETQIELYIETLLAQMRNETTDITLPSTVTKAIETYYRPIFDIYISNWGTSIQTLQTILDADTTFATYEAEKLEIIQKQLVNLLYKDDFIDVTE